MADPDPTETDERMPTVHEVRERYVDGFPMDTWAVARTEIGAEFDAWLARRDAEMKAAALEHFVTEGEFGRRFFGGPTKDMVVGWALAEAARYREEGTSHE